MNRRLPDERDLKTHTEAFLLARLRAEGNRLRHLIKQKNEALDFYRDKSNWNPNRLCAGAYRDRGKRADKARFVEGSERYE